MTSDVAPRSVWWAYERAQLRSGLIAALPLWGFALAAAWMGPDANQTLALGAGLFAAASWLGWRGRQWRREVQRAALIGALPFGAAFIAGLVGHVCTSAGCVSVCAPACTAAGAAAGWLLGRQLLSTAGQPGTRSSAWVSWGAAFALVIGIGSLGCECLGVGSLVGAVAGQTAASFPFVILTWRRLHP